MSEIGSLRDVTRDLIMVHEYLQQYRTTIQNRETYRNTSRLEIWLKQFACLQKVLAEDLTKRGTDHRVEAPIAL